MSDDTPDDIDNAPQKGIAWRRAQRRARRYLRDPERLNELLFRAGAKADRRREGAMAKVWAEFRTLLRMLKAYAKGEYRVIPWQSLLLITASVVYFVMPFDAIADFTPLLGFVDDATLLAWTLSRVRGDIDAFLRWENEQGTATDDGGDA